MTAQQIKILALSILSLLCLESRSQESKRPFTVDDIINLKKILEHQTSPDGKWIAYTVTETDLQKDKSETRVWMISTEGGTPIPMTAKGYSASQPRWSPDNQYLSFLATKTAEEKVQVWVLNRLGGEAQQVTNINQGVLGHEWSPDGKRLVLLIRDPKPEELTGDIEDDKKPEPIVVNRLQFKRDYEGYLNRYRNHLYIFTLGDSAAIQITSGDFDDSNPVWSPDGKSVAFVSNRTENPDGNSNTDIWIVSADNTDKGENLLQITKSPNMDRSPVWSPDGMNIAYITSNDKELLWYASIQLAIIPSTGGQPNLLSAKLDRNISNPKFSSDGKSIFFILEDSGAKILASIGISGKNFIRVIDGNYSISDYSIEGSLISLLLSRFQEPGEIYACENDQLKKITNINEAVLNTLEKASVEKIHFNSKDGTKVEGFVIKPPGFNPSIKYPAILWIHGGPTDQFEYGFELNSDAAIYYIPPIVFSANGFVTILINPRGSSGYGQAFSEAIFADWGNKDYQDVIAGVDYVIDQGYVDSNRLGVGGWSYGGILTNYIITKTDRFKGAISGASEALYRSNYGHDQYQLTWEMEFGLPWENAEAWESISPFNEVAKITTPTLWMGGSDDWNCPILNSEQMYQAMKRLGKETQLVVYPGENHIVQRPSFVIDMLERFLQWFDNYVK